MIGGGRPQLILKGYCDLQECQGQEETVGYDCLVLVDAAAAIVLSIGEAWVRV